MQVLHFLILVNFISLLIVNQVTEVDGTLNKEEKGILVDFFNKKGFAIDTSDEALMSRYDKDIIKKMKDDEKLTDCYDDTLSAYVHNAEINTMLYESELKKTTTGREDEAVLRALDLIVPSPEYAAARKDLKEFYEEQPILAKELLERIKVSSDSKDLHTENAARFLRNFYNHWIPLGRLTRFIEKGMNG